MESTASNPPPILKPPLEQDEEEIRISRVVRVLCLMISLGLMLSAIHTAMDGQWKTIGIMAGGEIGVLLSFWLCLAGRLVWSTRLLVFTVLATATVLVCLAGDGIHDVVIMVYPSSLVVASQILPRRSFIAYAVVLILSVAAVVTSEIQGYLVTRWSALTRWSDLVDISIILLVTAVAVEMLTESLRKSLFRSQRNEEALEAGNLELARQAECLRRSEENYREIFNATSEGIMVHDAANGEILDVNRTTMEMYGYSRDEMLRLKINDLSPGESPYSEAEAMRWFQRAVEVGPQIFEWMGRRKSGEFFWAEVALKSTNIGGEGRVMAVVRDVSKRKDAEEKLRESRQILLSVLDTIPVRVFWKDENLNYLGCNRPFAIDAGFSSPEEIIGKTDSDLVWKEHARNYRKADMQIIDSGIPKMQQEEPRVTADGRKIWLRMSKTPLLDGSEKVRGLLGSYEDITDYRKLESQLRQAQKMDAFGQLAGGVAHDFNNILTVILSHASLLEMGHFQEEKYTQSIQQITQAAERAANLTRQLLTFSRRQILQTVDLDLNEVVGNMTKMLQRLIGENIALQSHYAAGGAPVHADPGMMEQVLMNLAVNSRDAMPRGGKLILKTETVSIGDDPVLMSPGARVGKFVRLCVFDSGHGISPENLPRIFEPFFTTKEAGRGTGLGLATVFGIIQQHQGWIELDSEVGSGTSFYIYLPYRTENHAQSQPATVVFDMPGGSETILLVEDEEQVRILARSTLQLMGYLIFEAGDGTEALKIWEENKDSIHLLLTDLIMPGDFNGRELADRLHADKPDLKVIFCSGYSDDMLGGDFALRGNCNFLQKPYNPSKLVRLVRNCLDGIGE
jgi:PAS domain S-box-containing protein